MLTIEKKNRYTADDYLLLEEGAPFQLINYDLVMSPSPAFNHQIILGEFYDILKSYLKIMGSKTYGVIKNHNT